MLDIREVDVLVVGAGPIGLACAIALQQQGRKCMVVEKGCLVNSLYNYPITMTFFSTAERLEIGGIPFTCTQAKPTRAEALEYYRRVVQHFGLEVCLFETVISVTPSPDGFLVGTSRHQYQCAKVIVATGFYDLPVPLDVPGETLPKVTHYYRDPHYYAFTNVVVVGGNNSAVDAALETWRKGARVTMVMLEEDIGKRVKYWVRPDIVNRIEEGSIQAYTQSSLKAIREHEVDIQTPDGVITVANDFVLAMTGYLPNFSLLQQFGVQLGSEPSRYPVYNPETMETNISGLYLAGVVVGGTDTHLWFIENSREHARRIADHVASKK